VSKNSRNHNHKDLGEQGTLNPNPEAVLDEQFASDGNVDAVMNVIAANYNLLRP